MIVVGMVCFMVLGTAGIQNATSSHDVLRNLMSSMN